MNRYLDIFLTDTFPKLGVYLFSVALRAWFIMFLAAVIAKRFDAWFPIGYWEAGAWALGYGLLNGLVHRNNEP